MYKAYVFDFDYTLANSEKGIVMCFQLLFEAGQYPPLSADPADAPRPESVRRSVLHRLDQDPVAHR